MSGTTTEYVQSGYTYTLTNVKSGTVMDLSGQDNKSIIGFPSYGTTNQQANFLRWPIAVPWKLTWTSIGWVFQSVGNGLYLSIDGSPADGTRLVATTTPFGWDIWHDEVNYNAYRIYVPNTHFNLDLNNDGSAAPLTPITLWFNWAGIHQTWTFTRV
ncbi:hypothetical protein H0H92_012603 [Tricholoma furcatifolium]|nr:hypothetical protein H0H92_012603 [Tricholoma furcatifolium]